MTTIYLIRHSLQLTNKGKMNVKDSSQLVNEKIILSVEGEEKAKEISELNELQNIDVVWSSAYVRAMQTAKYIALKNRLQINIDRQFNERKIGQITQKQIKTNFLLTKNQLIHHKFKNKFGENLEEVKKRMTKAINNILQNYVDKRIVIVTHGAAMKFYLTNFCQLNDKNELLFNEKVLDFSSPSVIKMTFDKNKLNDIKNI